MGNCLLRLILLYMSCPQFAFSLTYCQAGTFELKPPLGGKEVCEHCLTGTFMPHHDHRNKKCFDCTMIEDAELEIVISPCNRTMDTVIQCTEGYYRRLPRNPREKARCEKCSECQHPYYEAQKCQAYSDTGCCPGENYDIYSNGDGVPLCRERPWFCRKGQYFNLNSFQCLPCPADTFMPLDYHTMTRCMECQTHSEDHLPLHAKILQSCSGTHQAVIECDEGYFTNHSMGHGNNDIGCSPCTLCNITDQKYEGRECGQFHDAVCCPKPNMTVVETPDGPVCLEEPSVLQPVPAPDVTVFGAIPKSCDGSVFRVNGCLRGEYLVPNCASNAVFCRPCENGSFMAESHHMKVSCNPCSPPSFNASQLILACNGTHDNVYTQKSSGSDSTLVMTNINLLLVLGTGLPILAIAAVLIMFRMRMMAVGRVPMWWPSRKNQRRSIEEAQANKLPSPGEPLVNDQSLLAQTKLLSYEDAN